MMMIRDQGLVGEQWRRDAIISDVLGIIGNIYIRSAHSF